MPTSPLPADPYKVIGVAKDATTATIRSAYRKLVLQSHPDKFPDEAVKAQKAEEFHRVQQAYEILIDEQNRERYDAQVRLAELKAERFREEAASSPRRQEAPPPCSPRPSSERVWSSQPIFEEIRPKARYHEDAQPPPTPSSRSEPRYEEHYRHRSSRDPDDFDDFSPAQGTTRKTGSAKVPDPRSPDDTTNRAKNRWRTATAKVTERTREKEYDDRRKTRDRVRRDDGQSKHQHMRSSLDAETASDTDSEVEAFMSSSAAQPQRKDSSRMYDDDKYYSRRKHESRHSSPDRETRANHNFQSAAEYIAKSLGKSSSARRPSLSRGATVGHQAVPPPPPPPPVPQVSSIDDAIRASVRRTTSAAAGKSSRSSRREPIEIVEPSRKRDSEPEARRPDLKSSTTSPIASKPPRSATLNDRPNERSRASVRRSATSPLVASVSASHSQKASKLGRESHESGSSSPDGPNSRSKTTSYTVRMESGSESETGPRYVVIGPDQRRPQVGREQSMHSTSHRSERPPPSAGSVRHGTTRSHTEEPVPHHRPAPLNRNATDRTGSLFAEIPRSSPEPRSSYKVQESPRYGKDDVHYAPYQRRSSPGENDPRNDHHSSYGQGRQGNVPIRSGRAQAVKGF